MFKGLAAFCQLLIDALAVVATAICKLFPASPFTMLEHTGFGDLVAQINFFLPVYEFLSIAEAWLIAVGLYYLIALIARWVKAIE